MSTPECPIDSTVTVCLRTPCLTPAPTEPKCFCSSSLLFPGDIWKFEDVKYLMFCDLCAFFKGELLEAIKRDFGSFANFKEKLTAVSVGVQGSGWGWLGYNKEHGRLQIAACANQDPLQGTTGQVSFLPLYFSLCRFHRQVYEICKGFVDKC